MKNKNIRYLLIYFLPVLLFGIFIGSLLSIKKAVKSDSYFDKGINIRGSIPNVKDKILKGEEVKLLYFGGSITHMDGWRNKTTDWLSNTFTNVKFVEFNTCISGSGSFFGVYRLEDDVINYSPDLVFIEFAVNDSIDGYYIKNFLKKNIEEIVCRIKMAKPDTDIVFVYTISKKMLWDYQRGISSSSAKEIEKIAEKYNIPSIDFGYRISFLHEKGLLKFDTKENLSKEIPAFSDDGVHPLQYGHSIYFGLIKDFFNSAMSQSANSKEETSFKYNGKKHKLFAISTNDFGNCGFVNMKYGKDSIFSRPDILSFNWSDQLIDLDVNGTKFGMLISMPDGNYGYSVSIDKGMENHKKFYGFGSASPKIYFSEFDLPNNNKTHHLRIWKNDDSIYNLIFFLSDGDINVAH